MSVKARVGTIESEIVRFYRFSIFMFTSSEQTQNNDIHQVNLYIVIFWKASWYSELQATKNLAPTLPSWLILGKLFNLRGLSGVWDNIEWQ